MPHVPVLQMWPPRARKLSPMGSFCQSCHCTAESHNTHLNQVKSQMVQHKSWLLHDQFPTQEKMALSLQLGSRSLHPRCKKFCPWPQFYHANFSRNQGSPFWLWEVYFMSMINLFVVAAKKRICSYINDRKLKEYSKHPVWRGSRKSKNRRERTLKGEKLQRNFSCLSAGLRSACVVKIGDASPDHESSIDTWSIHQCWQTHVDPMSKLFVHQLGLWLSLDYPQ